MKGMFGFKTRRRRRLMAQRLPDEWIAIIDRNVPYYRLLNPEDQVSLQGFIQVFLEEKQFEGCGGLEITDEIRVTIAAQACILLLGRETDFYPDLRSILVYPYAYVAQVKQNQPDGTVLEDSEPRLGESWSHGYVVLSWNDVLHGASDINDGKNVVFHEFAHQLDNESGAADGAPVLPQRSMYLTWARVLSKEFNSLVESIIHDRPTLLNRYGAKNPAEFFAVITEFFFEKPIELQTLHPELYQQLQLFYQSDPALLVSNAPANNR